MKKLVSPAVRILSVLLVGTGAVAEPPGLTQIDTDSTLIVVKDDADPLTAQSISQSVVPYSVVDGTSVICVSAVTVEHGYWRLFDLDDDHGLTGEFCVENIDWATQSVIGDGLVTVSVYCLDEGLPFLMQHLTLQDSTVLPVADEELTFHNTAVGGCCDTASQDMAVELYGEDCHLTGCIQVIIGMNNLGQTAPTYIRTPSCGIWEPEDLASVGFPDAHLIMVVHGEDEGGPDDGGDDGDDAATTGAVFEAKLLASDGQVEDKLGWSVALDGDRAVLGAYEQADRRGAAYVFTRAGGVWTEQAKLVASDGDAYDQFGRSVALDGETVVVGAPKQYNVDFVGSAYVFAKVGGVWTEQAKLVPTGDDYSTGFGGSVAVGGDTALIGAHLDNDNNRSGSVFVFARTGSVWTMQTKLLPSSAQSWEYFGRAVALDGDTALIGAVSGRDNGVPTGAAYVFERAAGVWSERTKLLAADGDSGDRFGNAVALDRDTAVIGSCKDDDNGDLSGSAYVFNRSGAAWTQQAKLLPGDGNESDQFGNSVGVDGETIVVGAPFKETGHAWVTPGLAYVFIRDGEAWREHGKLVAPDAEVDDWFGWAVSVAGDQVLVGAPSDANENGPVSGAGYVFRVVPDEDVPAHGRLGILLLLLTVLGTGVYFMRRRATD